MSATPDADLIVAILTRAVLGQPMPAHRSPEFHDALKAIERINSRALAGAGGRDAAKMGMACCVLLLQALRQSAHAEKGRELKRGCIN